MVPCAPRTASEQGELTFMAVAIKPQSPSAAAKPGADKRFESLVLDFLSYLELERGLSRNTLNASINTCLISSGTSPKKNCS